MQSFSSLEDALGSEMLREWQKTLITASTALRRVVGPRMPLEGAPGETPGDSSHAQG